MVTLVDRQLRLLHVFRAVLYSDPFRNHHH
jgi:hypothetical protein